MNKVANGAYEDHQQDDYALASSFDSSVGHRDSRNVDNVVNMGTKSSDSIVEVVDGLMSDISKRSDQVSSINQQVQSWSNLTQATLNCASQLLTVMVDYRSEAEFLYGKIMSYLERCSDSDIEMAKIHFQRLQSLSRINQETTGAMQSITGSINWHAQVIQRTAVCGEVINDSAVQVIKSFEQLTETLYNHAPASNEFNFVQQRLNHAYLCANTIRNLSQATHFSAQTNRFLVEQSDELCARSYSINNKISEMCSIVFSKLGGK